MQLIRKTSIVSLNSYYTLDFDKISKQVGITLESISKTAKDIQDNEYVFKWF